MARSSRASTIMYLIQLIIFLIGLTVVLLVVIEHRFDKMVLIGRNIQRNQPGATRPVQKQLLILFTDSSSVSWPSVSPLIKKQRVQFMVNDIGLYLKDKFGTEGAEDTTAGNDAAPSRGIDINNLTVYVHDIESEVTKPSSLNTFPIVSNPVVADVRLGPVYEVTDHLNRTEYYFHSKNFASNCNADSTSKSCDATSMIHVDEVVKAVQAIVSNKEKENNNQKIFSNIYAFIVDTSLYTDYGEYSGPATKGWDPSIGRIWKSGERSPYVATHTIFSRPKRFRSSSNPELDKKLRSEWHEWWWNTQGPMSEMVQPRVKYARSFVKKILTPDTPQVDGVVIEVWPSSAHVSDMFLFFDAENVLGLVIQLGVMMRSVLYFLDLLSITGSILGEYVIL